MNKKILGAILIIISMTIAFNSLNLTGALINFNVNFSYLGILTITFFLFGILFLSSLDKKIIGGMIGFATIAGIYKATQEKESSNRIPEEITPSKIKVIYPAKTVQGRFERTYRWDAILDETENKYGIPKGLLKGLAMRESYGDPLRLNEDSDGGAGLFMFQPGTAREMGLKVYGSSKKTGRDKKHGKELKNLMKKEKYNYEVLSKFDERFDINKSSDAAARYLKQLYLKHKSWENAISAYNRGKPHLYPKRTEHVKKTYEYKDYYNKRDLS